MADDGTSSVNPRLSSIAAAADLPHIDTQANSKEGQPKSAVEGLLAPPQSATTPAARPSSHLLPPSMAKVPSKKSILHPTIINHLSSERLQEYLIYTHSQPVPSRLQTLKEVRSIFRLMQMVLSAGRTFYQSLLPLLPPFFIGNSNTNLGAFATMFYAALSKENDVSIISQSGVSLMTFTSISAFVRFLIWVYIQKLFTTK